ncbi:MAG TPA: glycolate oxidase subunit GlcE [Burkholderiales bacterium]|nr:glycolate oxidase subunit GlcE [Burkholderiales bacterium]
MTLEELRARIAEAAAQRRALRLRGGGTKDFYGGEPTGELLDTAGYRGILTYEPTELVVTARCGTPLAELEAALAGQGQWLPFEPPHFGSGATVGGCVAAGLSGPARASAGALRDFVLGIRAIDGRARVLGFGGQVMKNVAGYDVSRLLAGSLGTLALIAEVSLKVLPRAPVERTLRFAMAQPQALDALNAWAGEPLPISASLWEGGALFLRLSGAAPAVAAAAAKLGGEPADAAIWSGVREQTAAYFSGPEPLWRLSVPSRTPVLELPGRQLIEWGGALRWLKSGAPAEAVREAAARAGGHAALFRGADKRAGAFAALDPVKLRLHRELKAAFDPAGILNPGRLFPQL